MKIKFVILFLIFHSQLSAQQLYWQQKVDYTIDVKLNDTAHSLDGFCNITYHNNAPDTLKYLWVHLWMNAFKSDKTAFTNQALQNGDLDFYFSNENEKGYINRLQFQSNGVTLNTQDHPQHIDIVKIILPTPLLPKSSISITTPFHVQIPKNFSRGGHIAQAYQITQWYPKVAMYDKAGWHEMPYVDQGEFYNNFGDYDVTITIPENYVVAATGELTTESEKTFIANRAKFVMPKLTVPNQNTKQKTAATIPSAATFKSINFQQKNVTDFAWFADKRFIVQQEKLKLTNGHEVLCQSFYLPNQANIWSKSLFYTKRAVAFRSEMLGMYPYNTVSVVNAPLFAGGGMEYPTITSISNVSSEKSLDEIIEHEVGHNWFQAIIATNERMYPWMDEGVNSYYDYLYEQKYYPNTNSTKKNLFNQIVNIDFLNKISYALQIDQPINTNSYQFKSNNYGLIAYSKTAEWLKHIANNDQALLHQAIKNYYEKWKFKHPTPADFDNELEIINNYKTQFEPLKHQTGFITKPKIKQPLPIPIAGFNSYNKLMLGAIIHNYIPNNKNLKYYAIPLYSFKTKNINGFAGVNGFHFPKNGKIKSIEVGFNGSKFNNNFFENNRAALNLKFQKITPFIRLHFKQKASRSPIDVNLQLRHFNVTEDILNFRLVQNPGDTFFLPYAQKQNYYVNQLRFNINRWSALYPYQLQFQLEQTKDLARLGITANQFFNYNSKNNGLDVRLFAGKIFYFNNSINTRFNNYQYDLNLLAPKGNEDYTYSNYFIKRNDFDQLGARQILQRDGFFKFRTDLLANKPGRSNDWIGSLNFTSTIPIRLNPLSILPIKIPIKLFLDLGTHAAAWEKNYGGTKFLYNSGLQLSLFKNLIEIYYPLVYSQELRDYSLQMWQKKTSSKNISFAININNFSLKKLIPQINY